MGARSAAVLLLLVLLIEAWAWSAADPDFPLLDPFRPLVIGLVGLFALAGLLPWPRGRVALRGLGAAVTVALLLLEVQTRARDQGSSGRVVHSEDRLLRYAYSPGAQGGAINTLGFWDRDYAIPKPPGVFRVAVLTGSIANDGTLPDEARFPAVLEEELARTAPPGVTIDVVNMGVEGYNTMQQVRVLEKTGLRYEPDLVLVVHMLTSANPQDGSGRRLGQSFFTSRLQLLAAMATSGSRCAMFAPFYEGYSFDLVLRSSLERLLLLGRLEHFDTVVAVVPAVEEFDDPLCRSLYERVDAVAVDLGIDTIRVFDAFVGSPVADFAKADQDMDVCHPNARGHALIAATLAKVLGPRIARTVGSR